MPKPENFDKLTPGQKRQARMEAWLNHENIAFTNPEAEKGYDERVRLFADVFQMKKPGRVPVAIATGFAPFHYAGYSCKDAMYDYEKLGKAIMKFHADFMPDAAASAGLYVPGRMLEILNYKLYHWPGHGVPENTSYQCAEAEYMKQNEYEAYLSDPSDYFIRTYLPRVMGVMEPWKDLPPFTNFLELPFIPWGMLSFGLPHIQESFKKLMKAGEIALEWAGKVAEIDMSVITNLGLVKYQGGFSKAPFDVIGDTMRGTRAMMLDSFRKRKEILEACERIVPFMTNMPYGAYNWGSPPTVFFPLHKGADGFMSPKDFKELYWPSLKAVMLNLIEDGMIPFLFVEGSYNQRLDLITDPDIPAGSTIWYFDKTDMKEVKKHLQGWACFSGNFPSSLLKTGTVEQVKNHTKQLLDDLAGDGGYYMVNGAVLDEARAENLHAFIDTTKAYKL
ncbi:MAG TPA: uroporphyrinogen decarboxylase family protein [Acidobacteriota bacterium]|nr:uroporphyrinogen decarboxylase family protein [Acidobacteriota bacterium]